MEKKEDRLLSKCVKNISTALQEKKEYEVLGRTCNTYFPIAHSLSRTDFMFASHVGITQYVFIAWCLIKEWIQFHGVVLG
jgi:hypothetical protein